MYIIAAPGLATGDLIRSPWQDAAAATIRLTSPLSVSVDPAALTVSGAGWSNITFELNGDRQDDVVCTFCGFYDSPAV